MPEENGKCIDSGIHYTETYQVNKKKINFIILLAHVFQLRDIKTFKKNEFSTQYFQRRWKI